MIRERDDSRDAGPTRRDPALALTATLAISSTADYRRSALSESLLLTGLRTESHLDLRKTSKQRTILGVILICQVSICRLSALLAPSQSYFSKLYSNALSA